MPATSQNPHEEHAAVPVTIAGRLRQAEAFGKEGRMDREHASRAAKKTLKSLMAAILGAIAVAAFGFFKDDITVRLATAVTQGTIGGEWEVEFKEYNSDKPNPRLVPFYETAELSQLGFRVIAKFNTSRPPQQQWDASGYFNPPHFGLAYISAERGRAGLGTYTLRQVGEGALAFLGYWTGVECKGTRQVLLTCPCLFVRKDHRGLRDKYAYHLEQPCQEIDPSTPEPCSRPVLR